MTAIRLKYAGWAAAAILFGLGGLVWAATPTAIITSVVPKPDAKQVIITYTLVSEADCLIFVQVSTNGGANYDLPARSFSGNGYGANVKPGGGKKIVWDMGADWGGQYSKQVLFKVIANDGYACYVDNGDGTVTDNATGLMWTRNANHGMMLYEAATNYCRNLDFAGYKDWRLPAVQIKGKGQAEFESLGHHGGGVPYEAPGTPFMAVQLGAYWSSVTNTNDQELAFCMYMTNGSVRAGERSSVSFVWPVRGEQK